MSAKRYDPIDAKFRAACELLGVDPDASLEEIEHAYRALMFDNHPDFYPGDPVREERTKLGNAAHDLLKGRVQTRWARISTRCSCSHAFARNQRSSGPPTPSWWPQPETVHSRFFDGCEIRPTDAYRCFRIYFQGSLILVLRRLRDEPDILFATNTEGQRVAVAGVLWFHHLGDSIEPCRRKKD